MKKLLALVLALVMSMSLVTISNAAFKDADKIDYDEAVEVMNAIGVLVGDEKGNFNAKENLTREQAAKIISYLLLGNKTAEALVGAAKFTDVAATRWSAGFVDYCASTGVVAGNGDGTFAPAGQLTGFQFAKMLLVALGYDAKIEGFTGTDWQINVSKVANQVGLFNGLSISGTAALTREQAAQMCLNTIKAPLVEYTNKGGSLTINGAEIGISPSAAEYVTTTLAKEQRISDRTLTNTGLNTKGGYTVEFGEKYYPLLVLTLDASDDFGRPAHTWTYDKKDIGTYVDTDTLVASYTTEVKGGEIFSVIGSNVAKDYDFVAYIDGKDYVNVDSKIAANLYKNNKTVIDGSGNGVLTEVYVDHDDEAVTVVLVNTYLAKVTTGYNAKTEKLILNVYGAGSPASRTVKLEDVAGIEGFKTDEFVLVNIANDAIVAVSAADTMDDVTVTQFVKFENPNKGSLTADGTKYERSMKAAYDTDILNQYNAKKLDGTYNVFLDKYGYAIGVEAHTGATNYVFVTGYDFLTSHLSNKTADAGAIFLDGTFKTIKVDVTESNKGLAVDWTDANDGVTNLNTWYTYTEEDGVYTLKDASNLEAVSTGSGTSTVYVTINSKNVRIEDKDYSTNGIKAYGNEESVFINVEEESIGGTDAITKVNSTNTNVKAVDMDCTKVFAVYNSKNYIIGAVVIGEDNGAATNYVYAVTGAKNEKKADKYYYWDFDAIVEGELKTLTVKSKYSSTIDALDNAVESVTITGTSDKAKGYMMKVTYDKDGYVVAAEKYDSLAADTFIKIVGTGWGTAIDKQKVRNAMTGGANLYMVGDTLYNKVKTDDVGLAIADDAKIVVIQKEDGKIKYNECTDIREALDMLKNSAKFRGVISATLNAKGEASVVVIDSIDGIAKSNIGSNDRNVKIDEVKLDAGKTLTVSMNKATTGTVKVYVAIDGRYGVLETGNVTTAADSYTTTATLSKGMYTVYAEIIQDGKVVTTSDVYTIFVP